MRQYLKMGRYYMVSQETDDGVQHEPFRQSFTRNRGRRKHLLQEPVKDATPLELTRVHEELRIRNQHLTSLLMDAEKERVRMGRELAVLKHAMWSGDDKNEEVETRDATITSLSQTVQDLRLENATLRDRGRILEDEARSLKMEVEALRGVNDPSLARVAKAVYAGDDSGDSTGQKMDSASFTVHAHLDNHSQLGHPDADTSSLLHSSRSPSPTTRISAAYVDSSKKFIVTEPAAITLPEPTESIRWLNTLSIIIYKTFTTKTAHSPFPSPLSALPNPSTQSNLSSNSRVHALEMERDGLEEELLQRYAEIRRIEAWYQDELERRDRELELESSIGFASHGSSPEINAPFAKVFDTVVDESFRIYICSKSITNVDDEDVPRDVDGCEESPGRLDSGTEEDNPGIELICSGKRAKRWMKANHQRLSLTDAVQQANVILRKYRMPELDLERPGLTPYPAWALTGALVISSFPSLARKPGWPGIFPLLGFAGAYAATGMGNNVHVPVLRLYFSIASSWPYRMTISVLGVTAAYAREFWMDCWAEVAIP
ncbi:hypothetical protein BC829DRAFT_413990 [Chytridium lagenaria]|nr:hypothetical protein BC829DRAFT_413990 [Chytridium lagenaria]